MAFLKETTWTQNMLGDIQKCDHIKSVVRQGAPIGILIGCDSETAQMIQIHFGDIVDRHVIAAAEQNLGELAIAATYVENVTALCREQDINRSSGG
jgi:hypothetical protein